MPPPFALIASAAVASSSHVLGGDVMPAFSKTSLR